MGPQPPPDIPRDNPSVHTIAPVGRSQSSIQFAPIARQIAQGAINQVAAANAAIPNDAICHSWYRRPWPIAIGIIIRPIRKPIR